MIKEMVGMFEIRTIYKGRNNDIPVSRVLVGIHSPALHLPDPVPGVVFVFGSNLRGQHGLGAAYTAIRHYGAQHGFGVGLKGSSYSLPTKEAPHINFDSADTLAFYIKQFVDFARNNPATTFLVTEVGTGLAGYPQHQVAAHFEDAPRNCILSARWMPFLPLLCSDCRIWHTRGDNPDGTPSRGSGIVETP